jgi:hypothetical protein
MGYHARLSYFIYSLLLYVQLQLYFLNHIPLSGLKLVDIRNTNCPSDIGFPLRYYLNKLMIWQYQMVILFIEQVQHTTLPLRQMQQHQDQ